MFVMTNEDGRIVAAGHDTNMLAKSFATLKDQGEVLAKSNPAKRVLLTKSSGASNSPYAQICRELKAVRRSLR